MHVSRLLYGVRDQTGISVRPLGIIKTFQHAVTKYRITLDCFAADYVAGRPNSTPARPVKWVLRRDLNAYPLSTTGRKITRLLEEGSSTVAEHSDH